ncbi:MAG: hypothetical protein H7A18_01630 [Sinobacteraceae bacterium]|nr:hypothetical protein [Nevskiaceae bacterium]MCP5339987.1 hypothetical protein [Nevskiaceae bacterium]MCP5359332.1 hypothetical protein [Nevskiaceae bacterium]MCP5467449.1 hypothetical protein [Nevskiaceae bacterium]MCP5470769.1 hypothetical protein [Nevskiaceae bacterium]
MNTGHVMAVTSKAAVLVAAAVAALVLTWGASWSFVDSTRVVHWITAADAAAAAATVDTSTVVGAQQAGLLK